MATVTKWTPFGVALNITATAGTVTRTSATKYTVKINVSWETYWDDAKTNYGMSATSGGTEYVISKFDGTKRSSGSGSFTGEYSISGNGSAAKTISVSFENFNTDNDDSATKSISLSVSVPAWTSYTVSYNANGGSGAPSSQTKWKDQALTLSSTKPTRTGYSFLGWATSSTATSATYQAGGSYTSNSAATLYAVWKANTYTIRYDANGGSNAPASQTKTYGVTLTLATSKPTRTNYNFKGWATSASATSATYQSGGSYTANEAATLYAVWELAYTKPRITNLLVTRTDTNGNLSDSGECAKVTFNWASDKTISAIVIEWKEASASSYTGSDPVSASGTSGSVTHYVISEFDTESSYDIRVTVTDSMGSSSSVLMLPSMKFVMDFLAGGNGAAVGKVAEEAGLFDIGFKTRLQGGLAYPVLEPNTDLNTVRTPNFYIGANVANYSYGNCPTTSGTFTLEVMSAGPDGQIYQRYTVCDKTGSAVYERFYYTSAWGEWYGGWIYPTLESAFAMYGTSEADNKVRYRKDGRMVEVRGIVQPTADIPGSTTVHKIFTLPSGYRPTSPIYLVCQGSGNCSWLLRITSGGEVGFSRYRNGAETYTASAGAWLPFQVTFFNK